MKKTEILLSSGSIIWYGLKESICYVKDIGYDGLEIVPSRNIVTEVKNTIKIYDDKSKYIRELHLIKGIHQNWRLDLGFDKSYGIQFPATVFFTILRFLLFPKIKESNETIKLLSGILNLPVVVHALSDKWAKDNGKNEFIGGILYEIIGSLTSPLELRSWMQKENHNIVIDSRDDQSLLWAKKYGFDTWQALWKWIGIKKIKGYQLTFIGIQELSKIFKHEKSLAEKQLLWLHKNNWAGHVTVEANPLMLMFLCRGNMKKGLKIIGQFIKHVLIEGKKWS